MWKNTIFHCKTSSCKTNAYCLATEVFNNFPIHYEANNANCIYLIKESKAEGWHNVTKGASDTEFHEIYLLGESTAFFFVLFSSFFYDYVHDL